MKAIDSRIKRQFPENSQYRTAFVWRFMQYIRERFPLGAYLPLILLFSFAAWSFSAIAGERLVLPGIFRFFAVTVSVLGFFLQLRIADEFKDFDIDSRFRPHRAVPRGLVTLAELKWVSRAAGAVQFIAAIAVDERLLVLLLADWGYMGLMNNEFFARRWLRSHLVAYLVSHMLIMPLIALYASAFEWLPANEPPASSLLLFLLASFAAGLVIEIGRKLRAPDEEREGVETYSQLWGHAHATRTWSACCAGLAGLVTIAGHATAAPAGAAIFSAVMLLLATGCARRFTREASPAHARHIEHASGGIVALAYIALGPLALVLASWEVLL